jgi:hypothetical protein
VSCPHRRIGAKITTVRISAVKIVRVKIVLVKISEQAASRRRQLLAIAIP